MRKGRWRKGTLIFFFFQGQAGKESLKTGLSFCHAGVYFLCARQDPFQQQGLFYSNLPGVKWVYYQLSLWV